MGRAVSCTQETHKQAAATENARSPTVDSRDQVTISDEEKMRRNEISDESQCPSLDTVRQRGIVSALLIKQAAHLSLQASFW